MDVEAGQLRCLIAIVEQGTFTDAAIELGTSQAAVSRAIARLEAALQVRLLRRTSREVALTAAGARVLPLARQLLRDLDRLVDDARAGQDRVRVGYPWAAVGRHTVEFQRRWQRAHPTIELLLTRINTATAGLAEGQSDVAIVRSQVDRRRFDTVVVGLERRYGVSAADDSWARRRSLRMADFVTRRMAIDRRTGTTQLDLWPADARPADVVGVSDIEDWLELIAAGDVVGMSAEATVAQYPRPGVAYRVVRDAPPVTVQLAWWRDDPPAAVAPLAELLSELYRTAR
jgi:DNA-binding transcriptional LysR family regulator